MARTQSGGLELTDRGMQGRPDPTVDRWFRHSFGRGAGVFEGRITTGGARLFYFRYTAPDGSRTRRLIGSYSPKGEAGTTLADARRTAAEWSAIYQAGARDLDAHFDRIVEQERLQQEAVTRETAAASRQITVRGLFELWRDIELRKHDLAEGGHRGRKDGGEYVFEQFERHVFPHVGAAPVAEIRKSDVLALIDRVRVDGKMRTANVLLSSLKQMFRFALVREHIDRNPLDTVTKRDAGGKDTERERTLSPDEVRDLVARLPLSNLQSQSVSALWLILGTAARIGELMAAEWQHVDLEGRTWFLPTSKNARSHTIHLSEFSLTHFRTLREAAGPDARFVFPGVRTQGSEPVCVKSFGKQLADRQRPPERRMAGRTKSTDSLALSGGRWTAHDLRRTAASFMAKLGISGDVIDECLNHAIESRVRRTYIRDRRLDDQARAFDALGQYLGELVTPGVKA